MWLAVIVTISFFPPGNINNSLMTLKSCLEILRENQLQGTRKLVPYRDSKLTYLLKNYFEGKSQIHALICVNPTADDFDETIVSTVHILIIFLMEEDLRLVYHSDL